VTSPLPDAVPESVAGSGEAAGWHRLHPLTPVVRAGRQLVALIVLLAGISFVNRGQAGGQLFIDLALIGVALAGGFISWLVTRWRVADGVLQVDTGLIRRDSRRFPLSQIQAIDVVQTGLARVLGLAELQLRVAGGDSSRGGRLACLRLADAEQLRRQLLAVSASAASVQVGSVQAGSVQAGSGQAGSGQAASAQGSLAGTHGVAASAIRPATAGSSAAVAFDGGPERLLFRVRSGRLAVAIVFSRAGGIAAVVIAAVAVVVATTGRTAAIASFLPAAIGIVLAVWRWFNGEYGTTVAAAPDGLRLRSGLVQITAETIRPGRVQGIRLVEPLIWRAFGWCRLEVDVAGPRQRREDRSEGQRLRAVVPVGSRDEVRQMIGELLRSQPQPLLRAPGRARLKAPLMYHFLGWGGDDRYVVASRGRVCRRTTWVPLEKVQSIRWAQGPVQRRLALATVHLDVAGKRVHAAIEDRADAEARDLLMRLPDLARDARNRAR
jgi:putative membrane protein